MQISTHPSKASNGSSLRFLLFGALIVMGFVVTLTAEAVHRSEIRGLQLLAGWSLLKAVGILLVGGVLLLLLVRYAEVALGLFFLVGLVKGDPRLSSTPIDLTLLVGGIIAIAFFARLLFSGGQLTLPREYMFYLLLLSVMVLSLAYTPSLSAGLDKILRFVFLTGLGIVAPFVIFDSPSKIRRFLLTMAIGGVLLAVNSLAMLGGSERLVSPSGLNTELGAASAVSLLIIWSLLFPEWSVPKRALAYPIVAVLLVALVGSGGRFANVSTAICLVVGAFLCRKLFGDLVVMGLLGVVALPFIWIPSASYEYLSSLAHPSQAMGTRNDLMALGVKMAAEHPLLGVGISGFRFFSPNPLTYNYPHNLVLELASETGLLGAVAYIGIAACSCREMWKQLRNPLMKHDPLIHPILILLVLVVLDAMVSGDINDLRFMWFVFGLPFVLRSFYPENQLNLAEARESRHSLVNTMKKLAGYP